MAAATTRNDVFAARRVSVVNALGRLASEAELAEYLDRWTDARVARSWLTLAGAAETRYTQEKLPSPGPIQDAEALGAGRGCPISVGRLCRTLHAGDPGTVLVRIKSAGHIPMKNAPKAVAGALAEFFVAER